MENPKEVNEEIKELARISSVTLKKGGVVAIPSSAGLLVASNFILGPGLQKLLDFSKKLDEKIILITDKDEKLNYILHDIPSLAYNLIEHSEKPMIIQYDRPSRNIHTELLSSDGNLSVLIIKDELVSRTCNLGLKVLAAIIIDTTSQLESLPKFSKILPEVDLVIDLPTDSKPKTKIPSIVKLGMNGEVKIIRK